MSYYCDVIIPAHELTKAHDIRYYLLDSFGQAWPCSPAEHYYYPGKYTVNLRYKAAPGVAVSISAAQLKHVLRFLKNHLDHCESCGFGFFGKYKGYVPSRDWDSFDKDRRSIGWII